MGHKLFLQPTGIGHIFFSMQNLWDMQIFKMNKIKRDCEKCHYMTHLICDILVQHSCMILICDNFEIYM